jgi:hypothetical protein
MQHIPLKHLLMNRVTTVLYQSLQQHKRKKLNFRILIHETLLGARELGPGLLILGLGTGEPPLFCCQKGCPTISPPIEFCPEL